MLAGISSSRTVSFSAHMLESGHPFDPLISVELLLSSPSAPSSRQNRNGHFPNVIHPFEFSGASEREAHASLTSSYAILKIDGILTTGAGSSTGFPTPFTSMMPMTTRGDSARARSEQTVCLRELLSCVSRTHALTTS